MAATIRDIRKLTGLSLATISKYLNGGNVLPENRAAIEKAIEELHYEVNVLARNLATKKTMTIGIVLDTVENVQSSMFLSQLSILLRAEGYGSLVCYSDNDLHQEKDNVRFLVNKKVDGIIVIPVSEKSTFRGCIGDLQIPIVLINRSLESETYDVIHIDNYGASYETIVSVINKGHEKIAIIYTEELDGKERYRGYMNALEDTQVEASKIYTKKVHNSSKYGYSAMTELLNLNVRPTVVFITDDVLTFGATIAMKEMGVSCPKDIQIISFGGPYSTLLPNNRFTMIMQPVEEICAAAINTILARISEDEVIPAQDITLPALLC